MDCSYCMGKGCSNCMAEGGNVRSGKQRIDHEKGLNKPSYTNENDQGRSEAGDVVRDSAGFKSSYKKTKLGLAKDEHHRVLKELKDLPKPKLEGLAKGGEVKRSSYSPKLQVEGVHPAYEHGESPMGDHVRNGRLEDAKIMSKVTSEEAKKIKPKLKGLAHGGEVKGTDMDGPESKKFMDKGEFAVGKAEGGEMDMDADMDNEMLDMCCDELLSALESKNKKEILESLKAIILSVKG